VTQFCRDMVSLQHDLFQRYSVLAEIVEHVFAPDRLERLRILDIGSGPSRLTQEFLGAHADVTRADVETFDDPAIVLLDPNGPLPFPDKDFDLVLAMDVLEHVENSRRPALLHECARVADSGVIIGCPVGDDGAAGHEAVFAAAMRKIAAKEHGFLQEHTSLGLPTVAATSTAMSDDGWHVNVVANSPMDQWLLFNLVDLIYSYDFGAERHKDAFNVAINNSACPVLRGGRHYRRFFLATRSPEITQRAVEFGSWALERAPSVADDAAYVRFAQFLPQLREDLRAAERGVHEPLVTDLRRDIHAKDASLAELRHQLATNAGIAAGQADQVSARLAGLFEQTSQAADAYAAKSEVQANRIGQLEASVEHYRTTAAEQAKLLASREGEIKAVRAQSAAQQSEITRLAASAAELAALLAAPKPRTLAGIVSGQKAFWRAFARTGKVVFRRSVRAVTLGAMRRHHGSERSRRLLGYLRFSAPGSALWSVMRRSSRVRRAVERLRAANLAAPPYPDPQAPAAEAACGPWQAPPAGMLPWFNPLNIRAEEEFSGQPHLNLLLPGIAMKHMSGGPNTAIALVLRLAAIGVPVRFISTDAPVDADSAPFWAHVAALSGRGERPSNAVLIDASDRGKALLIGENDVFVATAWWTAQMAKYAVRHTKHTRFVYLIQDYEPLLHAASTQLALAEETYGLDCIPVVNSSLLLEFLIANRIGRFADPRFAAWALMFEPAVDTTRFFPPPASPNLPAAVSPKRRLLFYARPTNGLRNLYELGVAALHKLMHEPDFDPDAWEFLGMGEAFAPVALGRGAMLHPLPWRDFDGYAQQMRESDVLLSLMLSPHPSYPPLEMAACGKPVITTIYANKTTDALARISPYIIGVRPTIEDICDGLLTAIRSLEAPGQGRSLTSDFTLPSTWEESFRDVLPTLHHYLLSLFRSPPLNTDAPAVERAQLFPGYQHWPLTHADLLRRVDYHDRRGVYADAEPGLLSLITPVWNTDPAFVKALADCVLNQDCGSGVEWIMLDNAPTRPDTVALLETLADRPGVRLIRVEQNLGIVGGLRRCLEEARNRYIVPLDADDLITPDCVRVLTTSLRKAHYPKLAYTDEDLVHGPSARPAYCKPDWDPLLFVHSAYIAHVCAIDRELALALGCYTDPEVEGSSDWDSFMRFFLAGHTPHHIPETLYSWRIHPQSTAENIHSKAYIYSSQRRVIEKFVNASGLADRYKVVPSPLFPNTPDWRIVGTNPPDTPVTTVIFGEAKTIARARPAAITGHRTVFLPERNDWAKLRGLVAAEGTRLIHLLASDVTVQGGDWVAEAVTLFELFPDIVVIGGLVTHNDAVVEADGYFGFGGSWASPHAGRHRNDPGYFAQLFKPHSVNAVSSRHCVVRADFLLATIDRLIGTAATWATLGAWLGAAAAERGKRVAYTPFLSATIAELPTAPSEIEIAAFRRAYKHLIPDPALLSPRLGLTPATAHRAVSRADRSAQEAALVTPSPASYAAAYEVELLARRVATKPPAQAPGICLLTLLYQGSLADQFRDCAASACSQTAPFTEWIILENGPIFPEVRRALDELGDDKRIRRYRTASLGIIGGLRYCLERATADYVVPLDGDDILAIDALEQVAIVLSSDDRPGFVFSDEDILTERGLAHPLRRGAFDPVLNAADSYVWHVCAFGRERALTLGVYTDPGAEYCHDWDTITRFAAGGDWILHLPEVLYHWRAHVGSSSNNGQINNGSTGSVRHMLERTIAIQRAPALYSLAPFPLDRGVEQLAIVRNHASPQPLALVLPDGGKPAELPQIFEEVILQRCYIRELDSVTCPYAVVLAADISPLGDGGCWEAMRLWEMHEDVALIGGRVIDDNDAVVAACMPAGGGWSPMGMRRFDAGPFAIALKPQSALDVPDGFFYCRTDLLQRAIAEGADRGSLARHLVELARAGGWRIAYSPLIEARARGATAGIEKKKSSMQHEKSNAHVRERLALSKRERAFDGLNITGRRGVEFGPLSRPLVRKSEADIYYVDHCATEDLKEKYRHDPNVNLDDIVGVDFVWRNEPAPTLLHQIVPVDYVVASHVIEHVPDLIGWLHEMYAILRDGGSLVLIVPDKRFTFDVYRRTSAMEEICAAHAEVRKRPGLRCIMDHFANVVRADAPALWEDYQTVETLPFCHGPEFLALAAEHFAEGRYVDVHCWVFTPWSFLDTLGCIVADTGLGFDLQYFQTTLPHDLEFYVRLVRVGRPGTDWGKAAAAARADALWPQRIGRAIEFSR
jgi:glycosyltransferase involved in cell wall biosynthesis/SAM-dependent methyltransferase